MEGKSLSLYKVIADKIRKAYCYLRGKGDTTDHCKTNEIGGDQSVSDHPFPRLWFNGSLALYVSKFDRCQTSLCNQTFSFLAYSRIIHVFIIVIRVIMIIIKSNIFMH